MAKQGDDDAHDACYGVSESSAVTRRRLLGWKMGCRKVLGGLGGDARSSPPAESGFLVKKARAFVSRFYGVLYKLTRSLQSSLLEKILLAKSQG